MSEPWATLFKPDTTVGKAGDNIFEIVGNCLRLSDLLDWPQAWREDFKERIRNAPSYGDALAVVCEYFTLEDEDV